MTKQVHIGVLERVRLLEGKRLRLAKKARKLEKAMAKVKKIQKQVNLLIREVAYYE